MGGGQRVGEECGVEGRGCGGRQDGVNGGARSRAPDVGYGRRPRPIDRPRPLPPPNTQLYPNTVNAQC